jgi:hypothetical protein
MKQGEKREQHLPPAPRKRSAEAYRRRMPWPRDYFEVDLWQKKRDVETTRIEWPHRFEGSE